MKAFPHDAQPSAATRVFVPVSALVMTAILACADSITMQKSTPRAPEREAAPAPAEPAPATAPPATSANATVDTTGQPAGPTTATPVRPAPKPPEELLRIPAFDAPPYVRVRVQQTHAGGGVSFSIAGSYRAVDGVAEDPDDTRLTQIAAGKQLAVATAYADKNGIRVNGVLLPARTVTFLVGGDGVLTIAGQRYRGCLVLDCAITGGLDAINLVQLEDYVAGVLYAEMPKNFGEEALKAQAIVARTYALFHALRGATLKDDQSSQMYVGITGESAAARRIVQATRGQVVTYDERLFQTFFHSTCGGTTASAAEVFGLKVPPPIATPVECDGCRDAPLFRWSRKLTTGQLAASLATTSAVADLTVPQKSSEGHALRVQLLDAGKHVLFDDDAEGFRNRFNDERPLRDQIPSMSLASIVRKGATFLLEGRGFGHGVGMCQYGARGMAKHGATAGAILERYYPTSHVKRVYG